MESNSTDLSLTSQQKKQQQSHLTKPVEFESLQARVSWRSIGIHKLKQCGALHRFYELNKPKRVLARASFFQSKQMELLFLLANDQTMKTLSSYYIKQTVLENIYFLLPIFDDHSLWIYMLETCTEREQTTWWPQANELRLWWIRA